MGAGRRRRPRRRGRIGAVRPRATGLSRACILIVADAGEEMRTMLTAAKVRRHYTINGPFGGSRMVVVDPWRDSWRVSIYWGAGEDLHPDFYRYDSREDAMAHADRIDADWTDRGWHRA
jgi:hypothetical protein